MTKQRFLAIIYLLIGIILPAMAQTFTEQKKTYPVSADGSKYVVSGFTSFSPASDEHIYANALLWTYYCKAIFRVAEGKLVYYLSDVLIESSVLVMKKVTAMEKLQPEKKASHKEIMDDFVQVESQMLNRMFDFIATHQLSPITHWNEISIGKPVKGMTEDECRLAFGKPQTVLESNGEVQWMYSSSFYVFFKNGRVETIIK